MLSSLHIRNYILIDSLDVNFPEGLVIITGQTGAGKTILLGALSFLAGAKADASMISPGADSCMVEAEFDSGDEALEELLEANEIESHDGKLLIRRVISSLGRSRSFINDNPVPLTVLQSISSRLVDIHSQHRNLLLSDSGFQLSVLDSFAGNTETLSLCKRNWKELLSLRSAIAEKRRQLQELRAEKEYNAEQLQRLNAANLQNGELETLEEEHKGLANAGAIKEALEASLGLLSGESEGGVSSELKSSQRRLEQISSYLQEASQLATRIEAARAEIDDVISEIEQMNARLNMSPERLEAVEERMSLLYSLMRRYGCAEINALIEIRDAFGNKVVGTESLEEELSVLEAKESEVEKSWRNCCERLSESRRSAAPRLASQILSSLRFLELDNSNFDIKIETKDGVGDGWDKPIFLFASSSGDLKELSKVASGGEISRIMLCLKAIMAKSFGMPTMIFDEIDTGVSGSVADKMGQMICSMGESMQVFSITHLPQVAAKGEAHYVVSKLHGEGDNIVSRLYRVEGEERVREIARLLSGAEITGAALQNARVLLSE